MKVLELFSGTGSVGKVCKILGYDCLSLDKDMEADIKIDIMDWNYKKYQPKEFNIIWASPPCTSYSHLQNCWLGRKKKDGIIFTKEILEENRKESDKIVKRTLEIIDYFKPDLYFIENPQTGTLKSRDVMKDISYYDVDYCMYSNWGYQKRTRIWTNKENFKPLKCNGNCGNIITVPTNGSIHTGYKTPIKSDIRKIHSNPLGDHNKVKLARLHKNNLGNTERKKKTNGKSLSLHDRYRIPEKLILSLFN